MHAHLHTRTNVSNLGRTRPRDRYQQGRGQTVWHQFLGLFSQPIEALLYPHDYRSPPSLSLTSKPGGCSTYHTFFPGRPYRPAGRHVHLLTVLAYADTQEKSARNIRLVSSLIIRSFPPPPPRLAQLPAVLVLARPLVTT